MLKPLAAALMLAAPAYADEAWNTEYGMAFWDDDVAGQAIFAMPSGEGTDIRIYLPGFSTEVVRAAHWGYWILPDGAQECDSNMTGPDGVTSGNWGRVLLSFDKPDYPSDWTAVFGMCFADLEHPVRAEAQ